MSIRILADRPCTKGGIAADSYPPKCYFLGLFKVDKSGSRGPVLRSHMDLDANWRGDKYLEVISGPRL